MAHRYTTMQKLALQKANPINFLLHVIGIVGAIYFLWEQNWVLALVLVILFPGVGSLYAWQVEKNKNVKMTLFREVMIAHAHPVNAFFHGVMLILLVIGLWTHDWYFIGAAIVAVCFGHLFGTAYMKEVAPARLKRLTLMDMGLIKMAMILAGAVLGAYLSAFVMQHLSWIVLAFVLLIIGPDYKFFLKK